MGIRKGVNREKTADTPSRASGMYFSTHHTNDQGQFFGGDSNFFPENPDRSPNFACDRRRQSFSDSFLGLSYTSGPVRGDGLWVGSYRRFLESVVFGDSISNMNKSVI